MHSRLIFIPLFLIAGAICFFSYSFYLRTISYIAGQDVERINTMASGDEHNYKLIQLGEAEAKITATLLENGQYKVEGDALGKPGLYGPNIGHFDFVAAKTGNIISYTENQDTDPWSIIITFSNDGIEVQEQNPWQKSGMNVFFSGSYRDEAAQRRIDAEMAVKEAESGDAEPKAQEPLSTTLTADSNTGLSHELMAGRPQDASTALAPPEVEPTTPREWLAANQQASISQNTPSPNQEPEENLIDVMGLGAGDFAQSQPDPLGANLARTHSSPIANRFDNVNLADEMGLTLDYASVNRADIMRRRALESIDPQAIRSQTPAFVEWAAKDEANAVIAVKDMGWFQSAQGDNLTFGELVGAYIQGIKGAGILLSLLLAFSFVVTWGAGLAPPILVRYVILRRPLSRKSASWLAASFSVFFWIAFRVLNIWSGEKPGNGTVWIVMFFVARWIMTKGSRSLLRYDKTTERANETQETKAVQP